MLEFDAASKRFGPVVALDACSFRAQPGRLTGFLGPARQRRILHTGAALKLRDAWQATSTAVHHAHQ